MLKLQLACGIFAKISLFGESLQKRAKFHFARYLHGFRQGKPLPAAFMRLRPTLKFAVNLHWKDGHLAFERGAIVEPLEIAERTNRSFGDASDKSGFFHSLLRGRTMRFDSFHRPAFRQNPSPCLTRRDQQDFKIVASLAIRQSAKLALWFE